MYISCFCIAVVHCTDVDFCVTSISNHELNDIQYGYTDCINKLKYCICGTAGEGETCSITTFYDSLV